MLQIQVWTPTNRNIFTLRLGTKILRYWRRIDNLMKKMAGP